MAEDSLTARNRINQRNFRARRQNYIKDLEERLRKYETEGVQATIEIQTAARQVTEQNVKLRNLLTSSFGMNEPEIDAYLGTSNQSLPSFVFPTPPPSALAAKPYLDTRTSSLQSIAPYPDSTSQMTSQPSVLSPALGLASLHKLPEQSPSSDLLPPTKKQRRDRASHMSISNLTTIDHGPRYMNGSQDSPNPEPEQDTLSESSNPQTPAEQLDPLVRHNSSNLNPSIHRIPTNDGYLSQSPAIHSYPVMNSKTPNQPQQWSLGRLGAIAQPLETNSSTHHRRPDETSCEDAARIIASMRQCSDEDRPENILLELGCRVNETGKLENINGGMCNVKNLNIFKLMDEIRQ